MIMAQSKDENTLMLHVTIVMVIRFSMKYLGSSRANYDKAKVQEEAVMLTFKAAGRDSEAVNDLLQMLTVSGSHTDTFGLYTS